MTDFTLEYEEGSLAITLELDMDGRSDSGWSLDFQGSDSVSMYSILRQEKKLSVVVQAAIGYFSHFSLNFKIIN